MLRWLDAACGVLDHCLRVEEEGTHGKERRKKGGALACGRPRPPLPSWPCPPESCGGGVAWERSAEEKTTVASSISGTESTPPPG
jgi:hypothetical protein